MIRWIDYNEENSAVFETATLGQAPATESTQAQGFSKVEKILLASVLISGIGLVIHLLEVTGNFPNRSG